jgi:hypothetical protein
MGVYICTHRLTKAIVVGNLTVTLQARRWRMQRTRTVRQPWNYTTRTQLGSVSKEFIISHAMCSSLHIERGEMALIRTGVVRKRKLVA